MQCYYLISGETLYSSLLIDYLEKTINIDILRVGFLGLSEVKDRDITVIIDLRNMTESNREKYDKLVNRNKLHTREVLFNIPSTETVNHIIPYPNVAGVFYDDDPIEFISKGVKKILKGELWFSRKLSDELLNYYRGNNIQLPKKVKNLTSREEEIVILLSSGASNSEIATKLFVSENTVKAHLHNVFKKLNVKNRLQAMMWAKGYGNQGASS